MTGMSKHIMVKYHWIRKQSSANHVYIQKITSRLNPADIFTKPLGKNFFRSHCQTLSLTDFSSEGVMRNT